MIRKSGDRFSGTIMRQKNPSEIVIQTEQIWL
jgi:hypothetical protein